VLRVTDGSHEANEHIPTSPGEQLLHDRIKELGLSESTEQLLNGEAEHWQSTPRRPPQS
jgi:hypothetical protein